jgi:hypothetical protein
LPADNVYRPYLRLEVRQEDDIAAPDRSVNDPKPVGVVAKIPTSDRPI